MAIVDTPEKFRLAAGYYKEQNYPDVVTTIIITGITSNDWKLLNDSTLQDLTPDMVTLEAALDNALAAVAIINQEESFIDAMRPIIKDWHQGTQTTVQALASAQTVLDNHLTHKSVMNTVIWPSTRLFVHDNANVTLGNISGNANAEAAYLNALFDYATRVSTWRK